MNPDRRVYDFGDDVISRTGRFYKKVVKAGERRTRVRLERDLIAAQMDGELPDHVSPIDFYTSKEELRTERINRNKINRELEFSDSVHRRNMGPYSDLFFGAPNQDDYPGAITDLEFAGNLERYHNKQAALLEKVRSKRRRKEIKALTKMVDRAVVGLQHPEAVKALMLEDTSYFPPRFRVALPHIPEDLDALYDHATNTIYPV